MRNDDLYDRDAGGTGSNPEGSTERFGAGGGMGAGGMGQTGGASGGGMGGRQDESTMERGAERARETFDQARDTAREKAHEAGEKANDLRYTMADKLKSGADRLRQRASSTGGTEDGPLNRALDSDAAHRMEEGLADGLESTADWIREADVDSIRTGIEAQVRNHPGRTLLVALGVGYLIGRAFGGGKEKEEKESSYGTKDSDGRREHSGFGSTTPHGLH
jgi:hypothetical protein